MVELREDAIRRRRPAAGGRRAAPDGPGPHVAGERLALRRRRQGQHQAALLATTLNETRRHARPLPREEEPGVVLAAAGYSFLVHTTVFTGPCQGSVTIQVRARPPAGRRAWGEMQTCVMILTWN